MLRCALVLVLACVAMLSATFGYVFSLRSVADAEARVHHILTAHHAVLAGCPCRPCVDEHFYSNVMINVLDGVGRADSPHSRHARTLAAARSSGSSPSTSMDVGAGSLQRFARSASASSSRSPTPRRRSSTCISTSSTTATATGATSPCARLLRHHPRRARLGPGATASSVAVSNPAPVAAASPRWRRGPAGSCIAIAFPSATDCRLRVAPRKTEDVRRT